MVDDPSGSATVMLVVAIALVAADGCILLAQRPRGSRLGGLWEFPGGKLEPGERPEAALVREVREELGIEIDPRDLAPVGFASAADAKQHVLLLLYRADCWIGEPTALVADQLAWVAVEGMTALAMPPADRPLVEALARLLDRP